MNLEEKNLFKLKRMIRKQLPFGESSSSAFDITESRLGLGWNAKRRRCWCEEGLIKADKVFFTRSAPSTPPILTSEFVIADLRKFNVLLLDWNWLRFAPLTEDFEFLWSAHLNEPGCVVGEHIQTFFLFDDTIALFSRFFWTEIERPGDADLRSVWNLIDGAAVFDDDEDKFLYNAAGFRDDDRDEKQRSGGKRWTRRRRNIKSRRKRCGRVSRFDPGRRSRGFGGGGSQGAVSETKGLIFREAPKFWQCVKTSNNQMIWWWVVFIA